MDLRGWGASSHENVHELPALQAWMDDIGVVMDEVGSSQATLFAAAETALPAMLFAATHPTRTRALVLYAPYARYLRGPDYPFGMPEHTAERYVAAYRDSTGRGTMTTTLAPSRADDETFRRWWARCERLGGPPSTVAHIYDRFMRSDVTGIVSSIRVPTLLIRRTGDPHVRDGHARYIADRVEGAELVEVDGDDHVWFSGDVDRIFDEVERFLTGVRSRPAANRTLATVLFTDIVDSTVHAAALSDDRWTALLEDHVEIVRSHVRAFRGEVVKSTGDGALATFDGPARAIHCAVGIRDAVKRLGIDVRAGLHTGEIERTGHDIAGIAVHVAARVASSADLGEVLVSRTVADLVAGSGLAFVDRGMHDLKGIPTPTTLLRVED
jgi:class 3 adenylate cyclase